MDRWYSSFYTEHVNTDATHYRVVLERDKRSVYLASLVTDSIKPGCVIQIQVSLIKSQSSPYTPYSSIHGGLNFHLRLGYPNWQI
jgi:hypothetical protein